MAKFRKRPVVIEAVLYDGTADALALVRGLAGKAIVNQISRKVIDVSLDNELIICTLEGDMTASVGDWIIKGVNGELYPCKPDIFEKTHDPVEES